MAFNSSDPKRFLHWLRQHYLLLIVLAFAALMRLTNLIGPVRGDDFTYLKAANDLFLGVIDTQTCCGLERIGIYWPIALIYQLFGTSFFTAILFPLLASLSTVALLYGIGTMIKNHRTGFLAALFWAVFPLDILQATQVLPDGIAAALTAAAVYFMLLAIEYRGARRGLALCLMGFIILWLYHVKELTVIVILVCALYLAFRFFRKPGKSAWIWLRLHSSPRFLWITGLALVLGLGYLGITYALKFPPRGALATLALNATDATQAIFLGIAPADLINTLSRSVLFDPYILVFLLAFYWLLRREDTDLAFLLMAWLGLYLLIAEWGIDYNFRPPPILYDRPNPALVFDRRHILFVFVPLVLVLATFFDRLLGKRSTRWHLSLLVILSSFVWLLVRPTIYANQTVSWLLNARALVLLGVLTVPLWWGRMREEMHSAFSLGFLFLFVISTYTPIPRYNAVEYQEDRHFMEIYQEAAEFLLEEEPDKQIVMATGGHRRLQYSSQYQLDYNWDGSTASLGGARIVDSPADKLKGDKLLVLYEHNVGEPLREGISSRWVPLARFADEGSRREILLFNYYSPRLVSDHWAEADWAYRQEPSSETLLELFSTSVAAHYVDRVVELLPLVRQEAPDFDAMEYVHVLMMELEERYPDAFEPVLSGLFNLAQATTVSDGVALDYSPPTQSTLGDDQYVLEMEADQSQTVIIEVPLKPGFVYKLRLVVQSSLRVQVLDLTGLGVEDSLSTQREYTQWMELHTVFVTPADLATGLTELPLFDILSTELERRGEVAVLEFELQELDPREFSAP